MNVVGILTWREATGALLMCYRQDHLLSDGA